MHDKIVWDNNAVTYEEEIFNVFQNDKNGIIRKLLKQYSNKSAGTIDYGCGIGNALSLLSPSFKEVLAVDISKNCIEKARDLAFRNVRFEVKDLAQEETGLPGTDFLLCVNVAISDNNTRNYRILHNALRCLNAKGRALFVLPSFESASLSAWQIVNWYHKEGVSISKIQDDEFRQFNKISSSALQKGILPIQDAQTKHYSFPELFQIFNTHGCKIELIEKVEYNWETELNAPPSWIKEPYPWDWLVMVQKES